MFRSLLPEKIDLKLLFKILIFIIFLPFIIGYWLIRIARYVMDR